MSTRKPILSKGTRRGICIGLIAITVLALISAFLGWRSNWPGFELRIGDLPDNVALRLDSFSLFRLSGVALGFLLIWSAVFSKSEPTLTRCSLLLILAIDSIAFAILIYLIHPL